MLPGFAATLTERVVHGVHRGDPRIAQRPPRVWRSDARGVPVGPCGRPAVKDGNTVSIPPVAAWRRDASQLIEIEIDNGLQSLASGAIA